MSHPTANNPTPDAESERGSGSEGSDSLSTVPGTQSSVHSPQSSPSSRLITLLTAPDFFAALRENPDENLELLTAPEAEERIAAILRAMAVARQIKADRDREELTAVLKRFATDESLNQVERRRSAAAALRTVPRPSPGFGGDGRARAGVAPPSPPGRGPAAMRSIAEGVRAPSTPGSTTAPPTPEHPDTNPDSPNSSPHSPFHRFTDSPSHSSPIDPAHRRPASRCAHAQRHVHEFIRIAGTAQPLNAHYCIAGYLHDSSSAEPLIQSLVESDPFARHTFYETLDPVYDDEQDTATVPVRLTDADGAHTILHIHLVPGRTLTGQNIQWCVTGYSYPPDPPPDDPPLSPDTS